MCSILIFVSLLSPISAQLTSVEYNDLALTLDKEKRFEIMYEIEKIVEEEVPWIMLMYESTYIVQQKEIHNFRKSFFIRNYIKYLQKK